MKAKRDKEEFRHIERLEWDEQDVEAPNMNENAAPAEVHNLLT